MERTIRKYIKHISLKNLIFPCILLIAGAVTGASLPLDEMLMPLEVSSVEELGRAAAEGVKYVSCDIPDLVYTGYDFYAGSDAEASFYYAFSEDGTDCVFFLVREGEEPGKGRAAVVTKDEYVNTFIANYAADLGLSQEALAEITGGFIVSGYDYNFLLYITGAAILGLVVLASFILAAGNLVIFLFPHMHPSCRRLKKYGLSGRDFSDIDRELASDCIIEAGNMFATSHYLVVFCPGTLYMVPLFNIVWAYKFASRGNFIFKRLMSYTLVVYTSPGGRIAMRGNRKKNTDTILSFLGRDFSHIAVGYSEEYHKKFREMFKKGEL